MKSVLAFVFAFVVLLGANFANAITISGSATPPTQNVVESMGNLANPTGSTFKWTGSGNDQHIASGQVFRHASAFTLDKITVYMSPGNNAATFNSNLSMQIRVYPYGGGAAEPPSALPGTPILTDTGTLPTNFVNNTFQYVTFDVTNTALTANKDYLFLVDFTSAIAPLSGFSSSFVGTLYGNGSGASYPNAIHRIWIERATTHNGDPDWTSGDGGTDDIIFYVQTVPEPSTFVLGGLGLVGLVGYMRKRRNQT
jgi:hypothetical protein